MNLLYSGKYKQRFAPVMAHLTAIPRGSKILELCFGDTYIADFCRKSGHEWKGLDINEHFIDHARKLGFNAFYADLSSTASLPRADVCIMMGSLYHFHPCAQAMLSRMLVAAKMVVISEPVSNLSSRGGLIGFLAKRSANTGKRDESFRYDKKTFMELLDQCQSNLKVQAIDLQEHGKDIIVKLIRNGEHYA